MSAPLNTSLNVLSPSVSCALVLAMAMCSHGLSAYRLVLIWYRPRAQGSPAGRTALASPLLTLRVTTRTPPQYGADGFAGQSTDRQSADTARAGERAPPSWILGAARARD